METNVFKVSNKNKKINLKLFNRRATYLFPVFHGGQMKRWKGVSCEWSFAYTNMYMYMSILGKLKTSLTRVIILLGRREG